MCILPDVKLVAYQLDILSTTLSSPLMDALVHSNTCNAMVLLCCQMMLTRFSGACCSLPR